MLNLSVLGLELGSRGSGSPQRIAAGATLPATLLLAARTASPLTPFACVRPPAAHRRRRWCVRRNGVLPLNMAAANTIERILLGGLLGGL